MSPSDDLKTMIEAAKAAAAGLECRFAQLSDLTVRAKSGPADLVSIADEEAEQTAHRILTAARPDYGFLGEEGGARGGDRSGRQWIVDPLDGTTNFLFGTPLWGVNVALAQDGDVIGGVIFLPMLNELYVAEKGQGAWLNGRRIFVSPRATLEEAVLGCGIPFNGKPDHPVFAREMARLTPRVAGIRRTGAASVDLAWVAAGRWDSYWERCTSAWDMAPGVVLVREAGGQVTGVDGAPIDIHAGHVCATNGAIHDALIHELNAAKGD